MPNDRIGALLVAAVLGGVLWADLPSPRPWPSAGSARAPRTIADPPGTPAAGPPAAELVVAELGPFRPGEAAALAAALPDWAEAIEAGTRRVTLSAGQVSRLRAQGFDLRAQAVAPAAPQGWPACYHPLDDTLEWLAAYATAHPDLLEILDIGDSHCKQRGGCVTPGGELIAGRDLLVARITNERAVSAKGGRLWIDGGLHAREIPTVELVRAFIGHLVEGYGQDPQITYLLDHRELYAGIASNPDGRLLVELGAQAPYNGDPWMWRKNANGGGNACAWPPASDNHDGVDLNRNHAFKWDIGTGSSGEPCEQTYRGGGPASEPEILAYEAFARSIFADQRGPKDTDAAPLDTSGMLINFHNATDPGTVLLPWGWTTTPPPNNADLVAIAERYVLQNGYQWRHALYPVSGNTRDWGYGELGIPSYVIELQGTVFVTPCDELPGVISDQIQPLTLSLNLADRPYTRIRGPEVTLLEAATDAQRPRLLTIRALLSDKRSGGGRLAAAEAVLARPGGAPLPGFPGTDAAPGTGLALEAVDGAFDSVAEEARLSLDGELLPAGRTVLIVHAADAGGHWGPPRAIFVEAGTPPPALALPLLVRQGR
jgi:hypothetical protein